MIEVRISETTFAPSDLRRYIGGASVGRRVTWPEVASLAAGKRRKLTFDDASYLLGILSPEFALTPVGLFLHGMPPHEIVDTDYARARGRFVSEGLNNHVHLATFTKSRVAQFEIGIRAIRQWIYAMRGLRVRPRRTTLYLNGPNHFTICIYTEASAKELQELDARVGGNIVVRSDESFLAWAFPAEHTVTMTP